jgi:hypothetical protein
MTHSADSHLSCRSSQWETTGSKAEASLGGHPWATREHDLKRVLFLIPGAQGSNVAQHPDWVSSEGIIAMEPDGVKPFAAPEPPAG